MKLVLRALAAAAVLLVSAACTTEPFVPPTVTPLTPSATPVPPTPTSTPAGSPTASPELTPTPTRTAETLTPTPTPSPTLHPAAMLPTVSAFPETRLFSLPAMPSPEPPAVPQGPFPAPLPTPEPAANLMPYAGPGRGPGLIVSPGGDAGFTDPSAVRISWYVYNDGPQTTNTLFLVNLLFDGAVVGQWEVDGLATNRYVFVEDYRDLLTGMRIAPGLRRVTLQIDPLNAVNETIETDNTVEVEILWAGEPSPPPNGGRLPNLALVPPAGKAAPLFVSSWRTDFYSGKLSVDAPSHTELSIRNESLVNIEQRVEVGLYMDGVLVRRVTWNGLAAGGSAAFSIADLRQSVNIRPGPHVLRLVVDPADRVLESDESDNVYEVELVWGTGAPLPADRAQAVTAPARDLMTRPDLAPVRPFGWDAAVTARQEYSDTPAGRDGWLEQGKAVRVDFAFTNASSVNVPLAPRLTAAVLVDGFQRHEAVFFAGSSNTGAVWTGSALIPSGTVGPGTHTVRIVLDPSGHFLEETEANNVFERVFTWHTGPEPEPPPPRGLTDDELEAALAPLMGEMMEQVKPVRGPGAGERDWTPEIIAAGRAGYFLVTGRLVEEEGFVVHFLPPDEFRAAVISLCMRNWVVLTEAAYQQQFRECTGERREIGLKTRLDGQVHLFMDLGHSPAEVLGTYFHELGHGLQDLLNPAQTENRLSAHADALMEAQAQIFEAASWRAVEEFLSRSLTSYPAISLVGERLAQRLEVRRTGQDEHDRGYVLLWAEALRDTTGRGSGAMLRAQGRLDATMAKRLFDFLVAMRPDDVEPWASSLLSDTVLINEYRVIAMGRLVPGLPVGSVGHPDLQDAAWAAP